MEVALPVKAGMSFLDAPTDLRLEETRRSFPAHPSFVHTRSLSNSFF